MFLGIYVEQKEFELPSTNSFDEFNYAVERASEFLREASPILYLTLESSKSEYSRNNWLILQWAVWYQLNIFQFSKPEVLSYFFYKGKPVKQSIFGASC